MPDRRALARAGTAGSRIVSAAEDLAIRLERLGRWRRAGLTLALGAFAALALPPLHIVPALFIGFAGLVLLIDHSPRPRAAFAAGWWFGLGHFVVGHYWLANAMLAAPDFFGLPSLQGWLLLAAAIAVAVAGLSAVLGLFTGAAAALARMFWPAGPARIMLLAIAWTLFEWLRGWILTGFPWNLIGYGWAFSDAMNQFASLAGIWGLSLVTVAAAGAPALLADWRGRPQDRQASAPRRAAIALAAALLALAALWTGGTLRLAAAGPVAAQPTVADVRLRLVQANIDPAAKGSVDARAANFDLQLRMTRESPGFAGISHVVWPETAVLFLLEREPQVRIALAGAVPAGGILITGVPRAEPSSGQIERIWNSLAALDASGAVIGTYDKFHLVPFGEYVPDWLPFLSKITPGMMDYSAGPGPRTLRLPGLPPVGPLICYEVIFPGKVVDRSDRPAWLVNLTNDGWYGISAGPYQHFASARLRAVEEGVPVVRAANTGISGVIDAHGRVTAQLDLGARGVLDAALPLPLAELTPYARWGDWTALVLGAVASLIVLVLRRAA